MLKPSYKSIEGQSIYAVLLGAMVLLYQLFANDGSGNIPVEDILKHAESAKDIAQAYQSSSAGMIEGFGTAKVVAVLAFVYKMFGRFTDSRTELKKKEMDVKNEV